MDTPAIASDKIGYPKGKKICLVPMDKARHLENSTAWINDHEVAQYLLVYRPMTRQEEEAWFDKIAQDTSSIHFAIETHEGEHIGNTTLAKIDWKNGSATTGTVIGNKNYWGKGFGTDAKMVLLHYAFVVAGLRKVCSAVIDYNERSLRTQLKCGYQIEGRQRQHLFREGAWRDEILLGVFEHEWRERWEAYCANQT